MDKDTRELIEEARFNLEVARKDNGVLKRTNLQLDNQMYIEEIKYFINHVKNNTPCMNNFEEAHILLNHILQ